MKNRINSGRFIKYCIVGFIGVGINYGSYKLSGLFLNNDLSWMVGIVVSMISNYILNEVWVFDT